VKARIGIPIALLCTFSIAIAGQLALQAQTPAPPSASAGVAAEDSANDLVVAVGKSVLVDCTQPIERIAVGSSDLAEATAVSPTEVMLNGKAAGETSLIVWQKGGARQFFNVQIHASSYGVNDKLDSLRRELRTELPGQNLRITSENGLVFLRGTVKDLTSADRAVQIASTGGKVVNLLYVEVPPAEPQILLKVRFASLDRNRAIQLGVNLFSLGAANTVGSVSTQQFSPPTITPPTSTTGSTTTSVSGTAASVSLTNLLNLFVFRPDINLGATIQALEAKQIVQILAEPNILTANGKQGTILAGGQYPYPVVQGTSGAGNAVTIQFKEFGVRLNFIPTITPRNTIRLQVAPEVSSLDYANGVTVSGFTIPGVDVRRVKTEVELGEGQSFAIGGLLDNRENQTLSKIPFIGDVPILGKFFQSITKNRSNTELIVIVTPEIVNPIPAAAPLPTLKYPEKFLPSNSGIPMTTPDEPVTTTKIPAPTMPVEKLIESMQPEQPLNSDSGMSSGGGYGGASAGATQTAAPAATSPPQ
jgi:pilus assembly protein CpaC